MFEHAAFRPLWPVIFFLPWFFVGVAYLLESVRHRRSWAEALRGLGLGLGVGLVLLTAGSVALADAGLEEHCPVSASAPEQAHWLADALFGQGAYRRAGECYEAAGEHALANEAFLKAVEPQSSSTAHQLSEQRDQAKALFRQLQHAFNSGH